MQSTFRARDSGCTPIEIDDVHDVAPALDLLADALDVACPDHPALPPRAAPRCRAFVPIWRRPWMTLGGRCYGASVLEHLGVQHAFAESDMRYPEVDDDSIAAAGVDVVVAPSEPYPFGERHRVALERIAPVVFVDGQDLFWWGVRTPAAVARLTDALVHVGR